VVPPVPVEDVPPAPLSSPVGAPAQAASINAANIATTIDFFEDCSIMLPLFGRLGLQASRSSRDPGPGDSRQWLRLPDIGSKFFAAGSAVSDTGRDAVPRRDLFKRTFSGVPTVARVRAGPRGIVTVGGDGGAG
jgi:hypothetical protein